MNDNHVQLIFAHYIEQFERINNTKHQEYYKWQIIKVFRDEMETALAAPEGAFSAKLYELKKLSYNLIDSYTQPFYGLVKFAEKEPETVRQMFLDLYSDDGGNIEEREARVQRFLMKSHELRDKYYPDSYLYKDDMHSVTGYLFLFDPDHNYIFKATHAQIFADCVEFYNDWGSGDTVSLSTYYRMCDQLVERIKASEELMATDASRFTNGWGPDPDTLYRDPEKHVLAFDLIYCCSTYGLFQGISFVRPKTRERQLIQERKEKAKQLSDNLKEAQKCYQELEEVTDKVKSIFAAGVTIRHRKYGEGIVKSNDGKRITADFTENGEKQLDTSVSFANGIISADGDYDSEAISSYRHILRSESLIKSKLTYAEKEFAPYSDYLE